MAILAIEKSWFAILNDQDIVEEVMQMPSGVEGPDYIKIPAEDQSLVGKRYNRVTGEFEVPAYYYAELDEKGIVVEIITSSTPQERDNWIEIPSVDQSLIGKWYDEATKQFIDPPAYILAAHSTDEICYKHEDKWLSKKLDEMESAIAEVEKQEGPQGEKGEIGSVGPKGDTGEIGSQGNRGDVGPMGPQGVPGEAGSQGIQGLKGDKGDTGVQGLQGIQGPKGDTGAKGDVGSQGPTGESEVLILKRNTSYQKGDIIKNMGLPSWSWMECSISGTTAACDVTPKLHSIGQKYVDGSCEWIIRHKGELHNIGDVWMTKAAFNKDGFMIHSMTGLAILDCHICDGTNGTVSMLDKFAMGANVAGIGGIGGANNRVLSVAQMPVHAHTATAWTDSQGNHTHSIQGRADEDSDAGGLAGGGAYVTSTVYTNTAGAHAHNVGVAISNTGGGQAFDNRPAFIALAFVQKIY